MNLLDRVRQTIRRYDLADQTTRVAIALSGGPDSMALTHLLRALDEQGNLHVVGIAHFNHQLRSAADDDERFCAGVAESLALPFVAEREDVRARAAREHCSIETAARAARYEFFARARAALGADVVALGHTRDDQAETFLLRLLRGAGSRGLAGMHPRHDGVIRPLLEIRRGDLLAFLDAQGIAYVRDATNSDLEVPRNRIRAELLPLLERRFNPSIVDVLADEADIARAEWQWLEQAARQERIAFEHAEDAWRVPAHRLNILPDALARIVVRQALAEVSGGRSPTFAQVEQVRALARVGGSTLQLSGCRAERDGEFVVLTRESQRRRDKAQRDPENLFAYSLSIPGEVSVVEAGAIISVEEANSAFPDTVVHAHRAHASTVMIRRDPCGSRLVVRNRRPGDRLRPLGFKGRKKLQDFFVDRKVPRSRRDSIPIIVDELDRIVWVAGHTIDEEFRVTSPSQAMLILRLKPLGGTA